MAFFNPSPGQKLKMNGRGYRVCARPEDSDQAFRIIGSESNIYRLENLLTLLDGQRRPYALKVLRYEHRRPETCEAAERISLLADGRATKALRQECITKERNHDLIHSYGDLEYALLRPWVEGHTWAEIVASRAAYGNGPNAGISLATHLARTLARLEAGQVAHCDLSSANIVITSDTTLALIDVEQMYAPELPVQHINGSAGYSFRPGQRNELWSPRGDRFAAPILFAELLGWGDPRIRSNSFGQSYFEQIELHNAFSPRYLLMHKVLSSLSAGLAMLFAQAWEAQSLADCPSIGDWYQKISALG